ncbi:hypothetical protein J2Z48_002980 [Croceifilum oryzae]|uniref:Uncharacterized protein n=1 Tax=Croceifilum oryzae TaxID=1553429 RepID=A0AAJ1TMV8_9BACL|nr:hypothetical protein [Croceifilum oryzae]
MNSRSSIVFPFMLVMSFFSLVVPHTIEILKDILHPLDGYIHTFLQLAIPILIVICGIGFYIRIVGSIRIKNEIWWQIDEVLSRWHKIGTKCGNFAFTWLFAFVVGSYILDFFDGTEVIQMLFQSHRVIPNLLVAISLIGIPSLFVYQTFIARKSPLSTQYRGDL